MRVNKDLLVKVHYKLYASAEGEAEELVEETLEQEPYEFIVGLGLTLPAFEAELMGKEIGDTFDFTLTPEQAYGEWREDAEVELPKEVFYVGGEFDEEMVYEDAVIPMRTDTGETMSGTVIEVKESTVVMDFNHPLAGDSLHFVGNIYSVTLPTQEDYARMSSGHGCGCGCGDDTEDASCGSCGCGCH